MGQGNAIKLTKALSHRDIMQVKKIRVTIRSELAKAQESKKTTLYLKPC